MRAHFFQRLLPFFILYITYKSYREGKNATKKKEKIKREKYLLVLKKEKERERSAPDASVKKQTCFLSNYNERKLVHLS